MKTGLISVNYPQEKYDRPLTVTIEPGQPLLAINTRPDISGWLDLPPTADKGKSDQEQVRVKQVRCAPLCWKPLAKAMVLEDKEPC
jgi:hypothetical protein